MQKEISFVQSDLESAMCLLSNIRGLLQMLRYSGQTPSEISGEDLEGAILSIDYIIGDVEDNIRSAVCKMGRWKSAEDTIRKGA